MNRVISITDAEDSRVAPFLQVRERDVVGRLGGFIAEGEVVLRVLARSRLHRARSILVAAKRLPGLEPILSTFPSDVPIYTADQPIMDAIAGFAIHRGVLAFGERSPPKSVAAILGAARGRAIILCLYGIANHDNMGGVFRNAAAFGAAGIVLDPACCDPLYRKSIRVSVGAALIVPFARLTSGEDFLALAEGAGFTVLALSPSGDALLPELAPPDRAAVLLGSEGAGLARVIMARALTVAIPMADGFDSLNLATASGIVLNHLSQEPRHRGEDR